MRINHIQNGCHRQTHPHKTELSPSGKFCKTDGQRSRPAAMAGYNGLVILPVPKVDAAHPHRGFWTVVGQTVGKQGVFDQPAVLT